MDDSVVELAVLCNQARLLELGLGHQPSHKTKAYNLSCLKNRGTEIVGVANP